jgi:hypothetical protein
MCRLGSLVDLLYVIYKYLSMCFCLPANVLSSRSCKQICAPKNKKHVGGEAFSLRSSCKLNAAILASARLLLLVLCLATFSCAADARKCDDAQKQPAELIYVNASNSDCITLSMLRDSIHTLHVERVKNFDLRILHFLPGLRALSCISCGMRSLSTLEQLVSDSVQQLSLSHNSIANISTFTLKRFTGLRSVILVANSIRVADARCFPPNVTLDLRFNSLRSVMQCSSNIPYVIVVSDAPFTALYDADSACCSSRATSGSSSAHVPNRQEGGFVGRDGIESVSKVGVANGEDDSIPADVVLANEGEGHPAIAIAFEVIGAVISTGVSAAGIFFIRKWCKARQHSRLLSTTLASTRSAPPTESTRIDFEAARRVTDRQLACEFVTKQHRSVKELVSWVSDFESYSTADWAL